MFIHIHIDKQLAKPKKKNKYFLKLLGKKKKGCPNTNFLITTYNWWKIKNRTNNEENLLKTKKEVKRVRRSNSNSIHFFHLWNGSPPNFVCFLCQTKTIHYNHIFFKNKIKLYNLINNAVKVSLSVHILDALKNITRLINNLVCWERTKERYIQKIHRSVSKSPTKHHSQWLCMLVEWWFIHPHTCIIVLDLNWFRKKTH